MPGPSVPHVRWRDRPARWLATRSLRGQLITGLVALLALACAGVGLVSYIVLSHTLLNQLDYQLQAAGGRYASCHRGEAPRGPAAAPWGYGHELQQDPGAQRRDVRGAGQGRRGDRSGHHRRPEPPVRRG